MKKFAWSPLILLFVFILVGCVFSRTQIIPTHDKEIDRPEFLVLPINHGKIIDHTYYILEFDSTTKVPKYTIEYLDLNEEYIHFPKPTVWFKQDLLCETSPDESCYKYCGYDAGHMVPKEDLDYSDTAMRETMYTTNVCPQSSRFNRGIWKRLEFYVRKLSKQGNRLIVITGPIDYPEIQNKYLQKSNIWIPDGFFKIIYNLTDKTVEVYLIPHSAKTKNLELFKSSVEQITQLTKLQFTNSW